MFTGLVEKVGKVKSLEKKANGLARLTTENPWAKSEIQLGDSIALNGCCLTVVEQDDDSLSFDVLEQTLKVTNLHLAKKNFYLNFEKAIALGARLGGHIVQGHIDNCLPITHISPPARDKDGEIQVAIPAKYHSLIIDKGSIALDGISLTIAEILLAKGGQKIVCKIIEHTWQITRLNTLQVGDLLNVEFDLIGKYVRANYNY